MTPMAWRSGWNHGCNAGVAPRRRELIESAAGEKWLLGGASPRAQADRKLRNCSRQGVVNMSREPAGSNSPDMRECEKEDEHVRNGVQRLEELDGLTRKYMPRILVGGLMFFAGIAISALAGHPSELLRETTSKLRFFVWVSGGAVAVIGAAVLAAAFLIHRREVSKLQKKDDTQ